MSITYGFFNSLNGDRKYNAEQLTSIFDGIITDGVFGAISEKLVVKQQSTPSMGVNVSPGRAWFNSTWTYNDVLYPITISESDIILDRIDTIVLEVNKNDDVRANRIFALEGTPATNPVAPTLTKKDGVFQYPLCDILVKANVKEITQSDITNRIGTSDCPFVTGILQTVNTDELIVQWQDQWNQWMDSTEVEFDAWFRELQAVLDENIAAELASRVLSLEEKVDVSKCETAASYNLSEDFYMPIGQGYKMLPKELLFTTLDLIQKTSGGTYVGRKKNAAAAVHRSNYRGKYLGSSLTEKQMAAIEAGTFEDLWLGDYWTIKGVTWEIVDFDYWFNYGDFATTYHHVVVMPTKSLYNAVMNDASSTAGGYAQSKMNTTYLADARSTIYTAFGEENVLQRRQYFTNAVTDGHPSGGSWYFSKVETPNEIMIFGSHIFAPSGDGSLDIINYTTDHTQLALFAQNRNRIADCYIATSDPQHFWLRDVVNSKRFAYVDEYGMASYGNASNSKGVRPVFAIGREQTV